MMTIEWDPFETFQIAIKGYLVKQSTICATIDVLPSEQTYTEYISKVISKNGKDIDEFERFEG